MKKLGAFGPRQKGLPSWQDLGISGSLLQVILKAFAIVAAGVWVFYPGLKGGWYGDDDIYLLGNALLLDPARVWKAWFEPGSFIEYYPIEQTVQWCQYKLFGVESAFPYLVTNLVLHLTSALLVWHLFSKLGLKLAWLGGLLFATYPLMVDTIGAACELKNTLSLPPFLLAMSCYLDFEKSGRSKSYYLALLLFLVAMLCKITMYFFPVTILLYAWWKRGRIARAEVKAALPFFVISLVLGLTCIHCGAVEAQASHYQSPGPINLGGPLERIALAGLTLGFYFGHAFFPLHPMPYYPLWPMEPLTPWYFVPWLGIALVAGACWARRDDWGRPVLFALAFFVLGLAPFLGFIEVSYMCLLWVSDHLLYIPVIALLGLVVASIEGIGRRLPKSSLPAGTAVVAIAMLLLGLQTYSYAKLFADREQLWRENLRYNPNQWILHYLLAGVLYSQQDFSEAQQQIDDAIRLNPNFANAYMTRGMILYSSGHVDQAIAAFQDSVRVNPHFEQGRLNLAFMLTLAHRFPEAINNFHLALQDNPKSSMVRIALAQALAQEKRYTEAEAELETAHDLDPTNAKINQMLGQLKPYLASPQPSVPNP